MNACIERIVVLAALSIAGIGSAHAFGAAGHSVASAIAAPRLCARSQDAVAQLGQGQSLEELSAWADRVRYVPTWEHSAPWHYMNVADEASLVRHSPPEEGDVLWAIEHFAERLDDTGLAFEERAIALRFLVHFIVDIHQPLHVGRAADRGGNAITFSVDGERTNLHRLWDSGIIARDIRPRHRYIAAVATLVESDVARWVEAPPLEWAEESQQLRALVYDFDGVPNTRYLNEAQAVLRARLAKAGVRLAATLNRIFC